MLDNYKIHEQYKVLFQEKRNPFIYTPEYVHAFDSLPCKELSKIRYDNIIQNIGRTPDSLLDIGYGNGAFLQYCEDMGVTETYGYEVAAVDIPMNSTFVKDVSFGNYDVITFFDVLEHVSDIGEFIHNLADHNYLVITVPECREYDSRANKFTDEWFESWKHRKVDEHLWHFSKLALFQFITLFGYDCLSMNNCEDIIRKPSDPYFPNILTGIFKKKEINNYIDQRALAQDTNDYDISILVKDSQQVKNRVL